MNGVALLEAVGPIRRSRGILLLLLIGLLFSVVVSLGIGAVSIAPNRVLAILLAGINPVREIDSAMLREQIIVLDVRLPRTLLALLVGGALATAGAMLQGIFRNPLAEPIFIGVSPGAALAAVGWIVLLGPRAAMLPDWAARFGLLLCAFSGALAVTLALRQFARKEGRTSIATLLFAGIALGALVQAATGLLLFLASDQQLREFTFWTLGSLGGATWTKSLMVAPFAAILLATAIFLSRGLDALALGEAEAFHVGIDVERLKRVGIVSVAAGVGAAVAVAGVIGFVGLVVPHLLRLLIGPSHKRLLIGSAILGGALLIVADTIARTLVAPAELPLGVVTAFLGAPFFLWLVRRHRAELGG